MGYNLNPFTRKLDDVGTGGAGGGGTGLLGRIFGGPGGGGPGAPGLSGAYTGGAGAFGLPFFGLGGRRVTAADQAGYAAAEARVKTIGDQAYWSVISSGGSDVDARIAQAEAEGRARNVSNNYYPPTPAGSRRKAFDLAAENARLRDQGLSDVAIASREEAIAKQNLIKNTEAAAARVGYSSVDDAVAAGA